MLHITNGDSVAMALRVTALGGEILAWRDVLHEGPVPQGLALAELSAARAAFLADRGWASAAAEFAARDAALAGFRAHDEVVLWFEHDLYDQLQLIQLLDWFAARNLGDTRLSLLCISSHPQVAPFYGLGQLRPEQLAALFPGRHAVLDAELALGAAAWAAFRAPEPSAIEELLAGDTQALPFLAPALRRLLEEYPALRGGLSRTERQIVELLDGGGPMHPAALFRASFDLEEAPFLGDASFWACIDELGSGPVPLVLRTDGTRLAAPSGYPPQAGFAAQELVLTDAGREVLAGRNDWLELGGGRSRWLGGVYRTGAEATWRWDVATRRLVWQTG